ncbi:esterase [Nisaea nitritireducens]|uniref:esterase n=1 Tax=Nisaea nitritireducens TaxID=568392 RepID=UPI0018664643|nr:esterase [Nisaea nitritireducens]
MFHGLLGGFWRKARLFMPFTTRWNENPLDTVESAAKFVSTRAAFVAQTTLYGYIRTRAGTRYTALFDEDLFVQSLNIAKWQVFLACTADLAGYVAASVCEDADGETEARLALALFRGALSDYPEPEGAGPDWDDEVKRAETRLLSARSEAPNADMAFTGSADALVHWAPISDELKVLDEGIVRNSIRFKWKDVRERAGTLLQAEAVLRDFRPAAATASATAAATGD